MVEPVTMTAIAGILATGSQVLSGIFGASAQRKAARAQKRALMEEKEFNLGVLRQEKVDRMWSDQMSLWRSGLETSGDTSAGAVIESNQAVLQSNIDFQTRQYDAQIGAAKQQAKNRFAGVL